MAKATFKVIVVKKGPAGRNPWQMTVTDDEDNGCVYETNRLLSEHKDIAFVQVHRVSGRVRYSPHRYVNGNIVEVKE